MLDNKEQTYLTSPYQLLNSLARELKNPLILMARRAELENLNNQNIGFESIRSIAEQTLKLLDGYLLMAQSEYGQTQLPLQSIGIGSVIYDVLQDLQPKASKNNINVVSDVKDANVMGNVVALKTTVWCLANLAIMSPENGTNEKANPLLRLQTSRNMNTVTVSVLSNNFINISNNDLIQARRIQGVSHLALPIQSDDSGIHLAVADALLMAIGSEMKVTKQGKLKGISFNLSNSQQLQLI